MNFLVVTLYMFGLEKSSSAERQIQRDTNRYNLHYQHLDGSEGLFQPGGRLCPPDFQTLLQYFGNIKIKMSGLRRIWFRTRLIPDFLPSGQTKHSINRRRFGKINLLFSCQDDDHPTEYRPTQTTGCFLAINLDNLCIFANVY